MRTSTLRCVGVHVEGAELQTSRTTLRHRGKDGLLHAQFTIMVYGEVSMIRVVFDCYCLMFVYIYKCKYIHMVA